MTDVSIGNTPLKDDSSRVSGREFPSNKKDTTTRHPSTRHSSRDRALLFASEEEKARLEGGTGSSVSDTRRVDVGPSASGTQEGVKDNGNGKSHARLETTDKPRFPEAFWDGLKDKGLAPRLILRDTNPNSDLGKAYEAYDAKERERKFISSYIDGELQRKLERLKPELVKRGLEELSKYSWDVIIPGGPVWQACMELSKTPLGSEAESGALQEVREYIKMNIHEIYPGLFAESSIDWKGLRDRERAAGSTTPKSVSEVPIDVQEQEIAFAGGASGDEAGRIVELLVEEPDSRPTDRPGVGEEGTESAAGSRRDSTTSRSVSEVPIDTPMISAAEFTKEELLALDESAFNARSWGIAKALSNIVIEDIDGLEQLGLTMENHKETFDKHAEKVASRDPGTSTESRITALEGMREMANSLESRKEKVAHIKPSEAVREWMGEEQFEWHQDGYIELEERAKKTYPDDNDPSHCEGRERLRKEWREKEMKQKRLNDWERKCQFDHLLKYSIDDRANILTEHFERLISEGKLNMENLLKICGTDFYVRIRDTVGALSTIVTKGFDDLEKHGLIFEHSRPIFNKNVEDTNRYHGRNTKYRITALEGVIETANLLESLKNEVARIKKLSEAEDVVKWMNEGKNTWFEKQAYAWETKHQFDHLSKYGTDDPAT